MTSRSYRIGPVALFFVNLFLAWMVLWVALRSEMGLLLPAAVLCAVIALVQTPVLIGVRGIVSRLLVLYVSMLLFLFLFGVVVSWETQVGSHPEGSWSGRLDGGSRIAIFGQIFALPGFVVIALANLAMLRRSSAR